MRWEGPSWALMRYTPGSTEYDPTKGGEAQGLPMDQSLRALLWAVIWEDYDGSKPLGGWIIPAEDGLPHRAQFLGDGKPEGPSIEETFPFQPRR